MVPKKILTTLFVLAISLSVFAQPSISGSSDTWLSCCSSGCNYSPGQEATVSGSTYCCEESGWRSGSCTVGVSCTCTSWSYHTCGGGYCPWYQRYRTRTCTGTDCPAESGCVCRESCCTSWTDQGCNLDGCNEGEMHQTRDCGTCAYDESRCVETELCVGVVCLPDGCNGICPDGCSVDEDPDCGCQINDACCGLGCTSANDNDCIEDTFTFDIYDGWTLISSPFKTVTRAVDDGCAGFLGVPNAPSKKSGNKDANTVGFYWLDERGVWDTKTVGITNLKGGYGYFVYSGKDCQITINGVIPVTTTDIQLSPGWAQIGSPKNDLADATHLKTHCAECEGYACVETKTLWYNPVTKHWDEVSSLEEGKGYRIQCINPHYYEHKNLLQSLLSEFLNFFQV